MSYILQNSKTHQNALKANSDSVGAYLVYENGVKEYSLSTAITTNVTTTTATIGSFAKTSHATGRGKIFRSDGSKWQEIGGGAGGGIPAGNTTELQLNIDDEFGSSPDLTFTENGLVNLRHTGFGNLGVAEARKVITITENLSEPLESYYAGIFSDFYYENTGADSANFYGLDVRSGANDTSTGGFGDVFGASLTAYYDGNTSTNQVCGSYSRGDMSGAGITHYLYGSQSIVDQNLGEVGIGYGIYTALEQYAGTMTEFNGVFIERPVVEGTLDSLYGLRVEAHTGATTTNLNIYSIGGENRFTGLSRFGNSANVYRGYDYGVLGIFNEYTGDLSSLDHWGEDHSFLVENTGTEGGEFTGVWCEVYSGSSSTAKINSLIGGQMIVSSNSNLGASRIQGISIYAGQQSNADIDVDDVNGCDIGSQSGGVGTTLFQTGLSVWANNYYGTVETIRVVNIASVVNQQSGVVNEGYGLWIGDQDQCTNNWAIKTGLGKVEFGDEVVINGSLILPYVAKTANYTITNSDYVIDCTANSFDITVPSAVGITGRVYNIKNSGAGVITILTTSSQLIDGSGSGATTLAQYESLQIQSNGANWIIL